MGLVWVGRPSALMSPHPIGGETEEEILRVDMLENQIMDFRMSLVMVCYNPDFVSAPVLQALGTGAVLQGPPWLCFGLHQHWGPHVPWGGGPGCPVSPLHPFLLQEKLKPGYLEQLPGKLKLFSNFLGDRKWFAGEKVPQGPRRGAGGAEEEVCPPHWSSSCPPPPCPQLTFVDFLMFDVLEQNRIFEPKCLEPFKNLKDFMERFGVSGSPPRSPQEHPGVEVGGLSWWDGSLTLPLLCRVPPPPPQALEKVAAYMKSSRFLKMPINNKMAKWGNKKE